MFLQPTNQLTLEDICKYFARFFVELEGTVYYFQHCVFFFKIIVLSPVMWHQLML